MLAVMQASRFERLSFDPFTLLQNGFVPSEVDVGECDVVQALVIAMVIVVIDEGFNPHTPADLSRVMHQRPVREYAPFAAACLNSHNADSPDLPLFPVSRSERP